MPPPHFAIQPSTPKGVTPGPSPPSSPATSLSIGPYLRDRITPSRLLTPGEPHRAKNFALLGDRLLDLYLYEARGILDERSASTGEYTILRSEWASNRFLSRAGAMMVPALFEAPVWDGLTPDEQARVTEALVAAIYDREGRRHTPTFTQLMGELLDILGAMPETEAAKNPVSLIMERFQALGILDGADRFSYRDEAGLFVCALDARELPSLQTTLEGQPARNRKEAKLSVAQRAVATLGLGVAAPAINRSVGPLEPISFEPNTFMEIDAFDHEIPRKGFDRAQTLAWFERKAHKDAFRALFLLQRQLDNSFRIRAWKGELDGEYIILLMMERDGERHWTKGSSAASVRQAKLAAGAEMVGRVDVRGWM